MTDDAFASRWTIAHGAVALWQAASLAGVLVSGWLAREEAASRGLASELWIGAAAAALYLAASIAVERRMARALRGPAPRPVLLAVALVAHLAAASVVGWIALRDPRSVAYLSGLDCTLASVFVAAALSAILAGITWCFTEARPLDDEGRNENARLGGALILAALVLIAALLWVDSRPWPTPQRAAHVQAK